MLVNSIVWGNVPRQMMSDGSSLSAASYVDIQGGWPGTGNLDVDPLFSCLGTGPTLLIWPNPSILVSQPRFGFRATTI